MTAAVTPASHALISFTSGSTGAAEGRRDHARGPRRRPPAPTSRRWGRTRTIARSRWCRSSTTRASATSSPTCCWSAGRSICCPRSASPRRARRCCGGPRRSSSACPASCACSRRARAATRSSRPAGSPATAARPCPRRGSTDIAARWPQLRLYNSYGLTEFTSVSHLLDPDDLARARRTPSAARCRAPSRESSTTTGAQLPPGEVGSLLLAGPSRMKKYWRDRARTSEVDPRSLARHGRSRQRQRGRLPDARRPGLGGHQPRRREGQPAPGRGRAQPRARDRRVGGRRRPAPDLRRARGGVRRPARRPRAGRRRRCAGSSRAGSPTSPFPSASSCSISCRAARPARSTAARSAHLPRRPSRPSRRVADPEPTGAVMALCTPEELSRRLALRKADFRWRGEPSIPPRTPSSHRR